MSGGKTHLEWVFRNNDMTVKSPTNLSEKVKDANPISAL